MKLRSIVLLVPLLAGCSTQKLPFDGRLVREVNSDISVGSIYYDKTSQGSDPVSLVDLCLINEKVHGVVPPTPAAHPVSGFEVELEGTSGGNSGGSLSIPGLDLASLKLSTDLSLVNKVVISFSNLTKSEVSTTELGELRRTLLRGPNCQNWVNNIAAERWSLYQVKAVYHADFKSSVVASRKAGASLDVKALEAEIDAKLETLFKSQQSGQASLVAVSLVPRSEWRLTDVQN